MVMLWTVSEDNVNSLYTPCHHNRDNTRAITGHGIDTMTDPDKEKRLITVDYDPCNIRSL